ncbi:MAG: chromate transporter [Candidatus Heimdallarchaeota archaeon]|nr:chromate transporter [Candidatus Heimdallarchaeota archaeon]
MDAVESTPQIKAQLRSISWIFFKIGLTAFGGSATSISMIEEEVVQKKQWLTRKHFLDLLGVANIIPGPNAVEMTLHIGYLLRGWIGLLIAGISFIIPAVTISLTLAIVYVLFSTLPQVEPILYGIKPVILAIILAAIYRLGKAAAKNWLLVVLAVIILPLAYFFDQYVIAILFGGGIVGMFALQIRKRVKTKKELRKKATETELESEVVIEKEMNDEKVILDLQNKESTVTKIETDDKYLSRFIKEEKAVPWKKIVLNTILMLGIWGSLALILWLLSYFFPTSTLLKLSFFFFGIGSILYGSGYVLIAYIRGGLVLQSGWLTEPQLFDAIAIGQFTPGPLSSTVTVVGYMVGESAGGWAMGLAGAAVATVSFYMPSVLIVLFINPIIGRLRKSSWTGAFLDSVTISSIAVMLVTTYFLGQGFILELNAWSIVVAAILFAFSLFILLKWKKVNSAFLVLAGAVIGGLLKYFVL